MLRTCLLAGTAALALAAAPWHRAAAAPLQVGSGNEAVIEPPVPHPSEVPCTVPLVTNAQFTSFNTAPIAFTPPAACPGPWAKVVLGVHISLNEGRQFDRTGMLFLAGVPIWFGTTAEPRATLAPSWTFQRDVTDDTALFEANQVGVLSIGNIVNSTYTSTITASAELRFYPATATAPAPVTADVVLPLPGTGGAGTLNSGTDQIATTATFPRNILKAKLDLFLQGQGGDEFWYFCVPTALSGPLESCGGGSLREGQVSVDATPAGVAPVYPWIFTGGIDPYLWQPIPGVQTLDFTPFTVDLSPFAGLLSNGAAHTIAASVFGDNNYFQGTGALRLFLDHGAATVTGGLTSNTLTATPNVQTVNNTVTANGVTTGTLDTSDKRDFTIEGTVTGSAGTTVNTVKQSTSFHNNQTFDVSGSQDKQKVDQHTEISVVSTATTNGVASSSTTTLHWPLRINYNYIVGANGSSKQIVSVNQQYGSDITQSAGTAITAQDDLTNAIQTADTLFIDATGAVTGHKSQSETASYLRTGTSAPCFQRLLQATSNVLTTVQTGCTPTAPH